MCMDELILNILQQLRSSSKGALDTHQLEVLINACNSGINSSKGSTERNRLIPKRAILPYFLQIKKARVNTLAVCFILYTYMLLDIRFHKIS